MLSILGKKYLTSNMEEGTKNISDVEMITEKKSRFRIRMSWIWEQFWHVPLHTVITFLIGQYNMSVAWAWGFSWELGEWSVKLSSRYKPIGPIEVLDSIIDLVFWLLGPFIIIQFGLYVL